MKQILVAGGAGGVGEAIVRALLAAGHRVIVPSRSRERLERLRCDTQRAPDHDPSALITLTGEIGTIDGAHAVRRRLAEDVGRLDALIPSLGGWWEGGLLDAGPAVWDTVMDEMVRTHYRVRARLHAGAADPARRRALHRHRRRRAAYDPVHGSSLASIAAAAQLMLTRALRLEIEDPNVDVLELVVDGPCARAIRRASPGPT